MTSFHEHNSCEKTPALLAALHQHDVALVSDAGTPGVNDPGASLASAAADAGITVVPIPGPSAVTAAIAASGLAIDQFVYVGFLPRRSAERLRLFESLRREPRAVVALETPRRLRSSLAEMEVVIGDRSIAVCREMTKLHEEIFRGTVRDALAHFELPRGEFTLVIEGAGPEDESDDERESRARALLAAARSEGARARDAVATIAEQSGLPKRRVYQMWLESALKP